MTGPLKHGKGVAPDEQMTDTEEREFMRASGRILRFGFPNPGRNGCPDSSVLQGIADGKLRIGDAAPWMKHLGACSECFRDFERYKEAARRHMAIRLGSSLMLALFAIAISFVLWRSHKREMARRHNSQTEITSIGPTANGAAQYLPFTLDLRNAAQVRGPNGNSLSLIVLPRTPLHVLAYLPMGSDLGEYTVSLNKDRRVVWSGVTDAQIHSNRMLAEFDKDFTPYPPGRYAFEFRSKTGVTLVQTIDLEEPAKRK